MCFPDPSDVAITPDGRLALVTSSGSDRVAVVDLPKLVSILNRRADLAVDAFQDYWLNTHADIVTRLPGLRRASFVPFGTGLPRFLRPPVS